MGNAQCCSSEAAGSAPVAAGYEHEEADLAGSAAAQGLQRETPTRRSSPGKVAAHACAPHAERPRGSRAAGVGLGVLRGLDQACKELPYPLRADARLLASREDLECADVMRFAVLPQTEASGVSLAELLQCERSVDDSTGQPLVGEADCFVSYARSCRWSALLEAVGSIEGIEDQYLWIDMLCTDADQRAADRNHQLCHIERVISQCGCECCNDDPLPLPLL